MPDGNAPTPTLVVFDLDGTLIDSDEALLAPFDDLGIDRDEVVMGSAVAEECARLGISMADYVAAYDVDASQPFDGVEELLARVGRWAIVSNKHPEPAVTELERLGWGPEVVMCADEFGWRHKSVRPLLERLGLEAREVALVGDSDGDRRCADEVGCRFVWAGWNPRVARRGPEGVVAEEPLAVLDLLGIG